MSAYWNMPALSWGQIVDDTRTKHATAGNAWWKRIKKLVGQWKGQKQNHTSGGWLPAVIPATYLLRSQIPGWQVAAIEGVSVSSSVDERIFCSDIDLAIPF